MEIQEELSENQESNVSFAAQAHAIKMIEAGVSRKAAINKLTTKFGLSNLDAVSTYDALKDAYSEGEMDQAKKDIAYGILWCGGGTVLTLVDTGFIFWGAIVFGGYQLVKGLVNYSKLNVPKSGKVEVSEVLDRD